MVVTLKPPGAPDRDRRPRATSNLAESYRQLQRLRSLVKQAEQQPAREPRLFLMNETKRPSKQCIEVPSWLPFYIPSARAHVIVVTRVENSPTFDISHEPAHPQHSCPISLDNKTKGAGNWRGLFSDRALDLFRYGCAFGSGATFGSFACISRRVRAAPTAAISGRTSTAPRSRGTKKPRPERGALDEAFEEAPMKIRASQN